MRAPENQDVKTSLCLIKADSTSPISHSLYTTTTTTPQKKKTSIGQLPVRPKYSCAMISEGASDAISLKDIHAVCVSHTQDNIFMH
jgi:hypothetical protein